MIYNKVLNASLNVERVHLEALYNYIQLSKRYLTPSEYQKVLNNYNTKKEYYAKFHANDNTSTKHT